jgi:hypothetical protein
MDREVGCVEKRRNLDALFFFLAIFGYRILKGRSEHGMARSQHACNEEQKKDSPRWRPLIAAQGVAIYWRSYYGVRAKELKKIVPHSHSVKRCGF